MAERRHALAPEAEFLAALATGDAVRLRQVPFPGLVLLRGDAAAPGFLQAVATVAGLDLPVAANRAASAPGADALWLGPDEWLLVMPDDGASGLVRRLEEGLASLRHQVLDVSASRTVLDLAGPAARQVLAKGCGLDLHPRVFAVGHCAQSALARAQILLHQRDDAPTFRLFVRNSFARYLLAWLADAMAEYRRG